MTAGAPLCAAVLVFAACDTYASDRYLEDELRKVFAAKWEGLSSVDCPDRVKIERQRTRFACQIEWSNGDRNDVEVMLDREGRFHYQPTSPIER